jgi:anaerobic ribonucleoside-triphosphate reductase
MNKGIPVHDVEEKSRILLDYWIEHNSEHEKEFRDWADKVVSSSTEVAQQLQKAATKMAAVSDELMKAKQALPKSKEGR